MTDNSGRVSAGSSMGSSEGSSSSSSEASNSSTGGERVEEQTGKEKTIYQPKKKWKVGEKKVNLEKNTEFYSPLPFSQPLSLFLLASHAS